MNAAKVFLVGAGPGDPGLITRRGLDLLRSCDVVLYDRLVAPELLDEAPAAAERVFVGKEVGRALMPQATIDALIVDHARAGRMVVRLKGGDPFVFGRGADEAQALAAAGIPFEVVPGITSAIAAPAYAGIPVTHSGVSSSFTVLTAHQSAHRPDEAQRWKALATGAQTLVVLMGVGSLPETMNRLIEAGRDRDEPAAVIEWGTTGRQRSVVATVSTVAEAARSAGINPPAVTIVGDVVGLRNGIDWFEARPLFGFRVVVTRPAIDAAEMVEPLRLLGAEVIRLPVLEIVDPPDRAPLDEALKQLADGAYEWAVFASAHAVAMTFARLEALAMDARSFATTKVAAVGPATDGALRSRGIKADLVPSSYSAKDLARALGAGSGALLLPRPAEAPRGIVESLRAAGWDVTEVAAYETKPVTPTGPAADAVRAGEFDALTFLSPSAVRSFVAGFGHAGALASSEGLPSGPIVVCIGPSTRAAAEEAGLRVDAVPGDHTAEGVIASLLDARTPR